MRRQAMGFWPWSWPWSPPPATSYEAANCAAQGGQWVNGQCYNPWAAAASACAAAGGQYDWSSKQCLPSFPSYLPCLDDSHCQAGQRCINSNCENVGFVHGAAASQAVSWWRSMFG